jgi:hypothetical protein
MTDASTASKLKAEGKCARLHAMWQQAGDGNLLPRAFAIELAIAEGANPSTARTQFQVWSRRMRSELPQDIGTD